MITEERLKELIEQKATIYDIFQGDIFLVDLTMVNYYDMPKYVEYKNDYYNCNLTRNLNDLFETKEEAKWQLEFGNITRTETLKLPTWEEAQKKLEVEICSPKGRKYLLETKIITGYSCERENPYIIRIDRIGYANSQIDFEYTKENYIEACRLAKKLFLGEEV